jgi:hypothetical protein
VSRRRPILELHITELLKFQDEDNDDDDDEEIPLDMEEVEAASKKARQDEDIHSEHVQVRKTKGQSFLHLNTQGGFKYLANVHHIKVLFT